MTQTNYRSDTHIFADARRALDLATDISAGVRVHVEGGVATLTGVALHRKERARAETLVRQIAGVQRVVNHVVAADSGELDEAPEQEP